MMKLLFFVLFALPILAKETLLVSILPQKYFIDQIAKDRFEVVALIPKGASPATYSLKPSQLLQIKKAKLYFTIGVPFERAWKDRILGTNPKLRLIDSTKYIRLYPIGEHEHHKDHVKELLDPHVWLAPNLVEQIARVLLEELVRLDPAHQKEYFENYKAFIAKIAQIDTKIFSMVLHSHTKAFLISHPSLGYFARSYGLKQLPIEAGGKEPKMARLIHLIQKAKELGIRVIFIEPQFPQKSAQFLAKKLGAKVTLIDPLAQDWEQNILRIVRAITGG